MKNPFRYFNSSPEIIRLTVMMYIRYPLSLRQVEDILFERGIDICHETVRFWWNRFGPMFAAEIRKRRVHHRSYSNWRWHLDEVFREGSTARRITSGVPLITKARCWKFSRRNGGIARLRCVFEARDEALWPAEGDRDRPPSIISGSDECDRERRRPGMRTLAEQPG